MESFRPWLELKLIRGLGERSIKKLVDSLGSPEEVLSADKTTLEGIVGPKRAEAIVKREGVDVRKAERIEKLVEREGIEVIPLSDSRYPRKLRSVPDPPPLLFLWGELKEVPLVGIVGPRRPSNYTLSLVDTLVSEFLDAGYGTVSGGASGVDMRVHTSTLERSGYTVCVLGSGLLRAGREHLKLLERGGSVLLSEMLPEEGASKYSFPRRNRIIAGLSEFLVIPEAGPRSGSLITASHADRYKRKVYVHVKEGERWEGCRELARSGVAVPFDEVSEITGGKGEGLLDFLKTPRTFDEVVSFLGGDFEKAVRVLTELELEGRLKKEGPYYSSL